MVTVTINNRVMCCTIILIVITVVYSLPVSNINRWKEHKQRIERYICFGPRPKNFKVQKLFPDLAEYDPDPWQTVLHRCDDSTGCCANKMSSCAMSTSENVTLVFFSLKRAEFMTRNEVNHTSCSCQALNARIK